MFTVRLRSMMPVDFLLALPMRKSGVWIAMQAKPSSRVPKLIALVAIKIHIASNLPKAR